MSEVSSPVTDGAAAAAAADVLLVLAFVMVGRRNHGESWALAEVAQTAWPFLAGLAVGWLVARAWQDPFAVGWTGVIVWAGTVVAGVGLRALSGQGVQTSFVLVSAGVLALVLIGWRLVAALVRRPRAS